VASDHVAEEVRDGSFGFLHFWNLGKDRFNEWRLPLLIGFHFFELSDLYYG
jgi:hypothetical protein